MSARSRRCLLALAVALVLAPFLAGAGQQPKKLVQRRGKVVPLADVVARAGGKLDADAAACTLVLEGEDGKLYPLIKDSGSRLFFKDKALLHRPMALSGRLLPGSQMLQVRSAHSIIDGRLHEIYYWCNICSIKRSAREICECCGGPMELREEPIGK